MATTEVCPVNWLTCFTFLDCTGGRSSQRTLGATNTIQTVAQKPRITHESETQIMFIETTI